MSDVPAHVVVLAGPSGAGKSRLAERLGLPVLRLDDFYKDGDDPTLPRITAGANAGLVDWDHPDSWRTTTPSRRSRPCAATARPRCPIYEIAQNGRCGSRPARPRRPHALRRRGHLRARDRGRVPRDGPARGGVLRHPAPARHVLAAPHPRPARAPQAAAGAGPPRSGADARPAAGRGPRGRARLPSQRPTRPTPSSRQPAAAHEHHGDRPAGAGAPVPAARPALLRRRRRRDGRGPRQRGYARRLWPAATTRSPAR